jgi:hypothetical protein
VLLAATVGLVSCGGDEPESGEDAFSSVERGAAPTGRGTRSAPRWEPIAILRGRGEQTRRVNVEERALQWRVRWRCKGKRLEITLAGKSLVRANCPAEGRASSIRTGEQSVRARGAGPWRVTIEQQVDTPLREAPLPAMR